MRRFLGWLLRPIIEAISEEFADQIAKVAELQRADWERMDKIEAALAQMESSFSAEMHELRERMDVPRKTRTGRPYQVLRSLAELGAQAQNARR